MAIYLLAALAAASILPAQAQWDPHTDPGRCMKMAGYITVGDSTVCVGRSASAVVLSAPADEIAGASDSTDSIQLAGLPPLSEALRFCDTLHDDADDYSTRMYCRESTKEDRYPAVKAALEANPDSIHVKRCINGAIRKASKSSSTRGFNASDARGCISRGVQ
ncbi:hypothetical protein [Synechococcus sp. CC9616]|uniref:hypothetical protein n=1 Tax=Synechococcus sp. CC9616 TaxID=110663 RepID=UPI00048E8DAD|nr:hypothetical protein [Synechococcus sp. CC9616]